MFDGTIRPARDYFKAGAMLLWYGLCESVRESWNYAGEQTACGDCPHPSESVYVDDFLSYRLRCKCCGAVRFGPEERDRPWMSHTEFQNRYEANHV